MAQGNSPDEIAAVNQRQAQIQHFQDVDSRASLLPIEFLGTAPQTPGAKAYFAGGPIPPNTDQDAWEEIWELTSQLTAMKRQLAESVGAGVGAGAAQAPAAPQAQSGRRAGNFIAETLNGVFGR